MQKLPLLLLPGLLNDDRLWSAQISALADVADSHVADLTGHDSMPALAQSVLDAAPPRFALAGLSMGGYVALEIMRRAPQRVAALALLDTQARPDTPEATENRRALIGIAARDFERVPRTLLPNLVTDEQARDPAIVDTIVAMALTIGPDAFVRQQNAIIGRVDSRPSLPAIACPTLVLCGAEDKITPVELHREMADAIPGARLVVIDGAAHLSTLGRPREVSDALRGWLSGVPERAA